MARSTSPKSETIPTSTRIGTPSTLATRSWSTARCVAEPEGRTPPVSVSHRRWLERTLLQLEVVERHVLHPDRSGRKLLALARDTDGSAHRAVGAGRHPDRFFEPAGRNEDQPSEHRQCTVPRRRS